jgi:hypothetical protein
MCCPTPAIPAHADHECPQPLKLLFPSAVHARPVGDSGAGRPDAHAGSTGGSCADFACGPPLRAGACPEGKMSCGRMAEMRALYGQKEDGTNV